MLEVGDVEVRSSHARNLALYSASVTSAGFHLAWLYTESCQLAAGRVLVMHLTEGARAGGVVLLGCLFHHVVCCVQETWQVWLQLWSCQRLKWKGVKVCGGIVLLGWRRLVRKWQ